MLTVLEVAEKILSVWEDVRVTYQHAEKERVPRLQGPMDKGRSLWSE